MSWSIGFSGKASKVAEALKDYSNKLSGQSKEEYDKALPNMVALVEQNFNQKDQEEPLIKLMASGHGSFQNDEQVQGQLQCTIEKIYINV